MPGRWVWCRAKASRSVSSMRSARRGWTARSALPPAPRASYTYGASLGMHTEFFEESELILIWGSNPIASNLHFWTRAQEAKRRGARLIAIDPYRSLTAEKCHQHIALKPGTDGALALGMMNVLITRRPARSRLYRRSHARLRALKARAALIRRRALPRSAASKSSVIVDLARALRQRRKKQRSA